MRESAREREAEREKERERARERASESERARERERERERWWSYRGGGSYERGTLVSPPREGLELVD